MKFVKIKDRIINVNQIVYIDIIERDGHPPTYRVAFSCDEDMLLDKNEIKEIIAMIDTP